MLVERCEELTGGMVAGGAHAGKDELMDLEVEEGKKIRLIWWW